MEYEIDEYGHCIIPEGIKVIEGMAFSGCRNLKSVKIPDSVTSIGNSAFEGCSSLESIEIPDSVTSIGSSVSEAVCFPGVLD